MAGISSCYTVACCDRNRRGGIKRIYLTNTENITDFVPQDAGCSHEYKSVTMAASTCWFKWEFERGTAGFNANATRENGSTIVEVELEFYLPKVTCESNAALNTLLTSCGMTAIVETYADDCGDPANNLVFVLGWDEVFEETAYMEFASGEQSTGVGLQDANGTLVKIGGEMGEYPREFSQAGFSNFLSTQVSTSCDAC